MSWKKLIFGSIGMVLFIACCAWGYHAAAPYLEGVAVQGEVVQNLKRKVKGGYFYEPLVEFTVAGEVKHRVIGYGSEDAPQYDIGATVKVLYVPKDPENAVVADFRPLFAELFFAGLFGFAFLAISIVAFSGSRSSPKTFYPTPERKIGKAAREQDPFALPEGRERVLLKGVVDSVRQQHGAPREEYVVICRATLPGAIRPEHFEAEPIPFHPGRRILGKSVEIYVDPGGNPRYKVMLEPVLAEIPKKRRALP